jgi:hypothetical protein
VSSAIFLFHPLHTEAVDSIVARADVLCSLLYLIAAYVQIAWGSGSTSSSSSSSIWRPLIASGDTLELYLFRSRLLIALWFTYVCIYMSSMHIYVLYVHTNMLFVCFSSSGRPYIDASGIFRQGNRHHRYNIYYTYTLRCKHHILML